jgi:uncharacterized membrane protein YjgN (DUF898 family)
MEFQDTMPLGDTAPPPRREAASTRPGPLAPAPATRTGPHGLGIEFTGTGSEYFRIWIVNLLLTIVTLGFYYPFAKARRLRYFHGNTLVGGHALGFHGDPWKMLRGFVLMLVFGAAYLGAGELSPIAGAVAAVAFALLWPALWKSSLRFRLANTSWRGLRMRFGGSLGGAYAALLPLLLPIAVIVAAGAFGKEEADALAGAIEEASDEDETKKVVRSSVADFVILGAVSALVLMLPWLFARLKRYQHGHYQVANETSRMDAPTRSFYGLMLRTLGVSLIPIALIGGAFALMVGTFKGGGGGAAIAGASVLAILLVLAGYLLLLVLTQSYMTARAQNLVWGATRSHRLRIASRLSVRSMLGLMLTNLLLTVITFGLYRPFAAIATAKLRLEAVSLEAHGDIEQWTAGAAHRVNDATGDAAGDLFGIDVGL